MIETLEARRLFHTFTLDANGLLTLITHPDSETIGLRVLGPNYLATIDEEGVAEQFPFDQVKTVLIQALHGDDSINIDPGVKVPMTIQGGGGNDTIFAGAGPTVLEGDDGNDVLVDGRRAGYIHRRNGQRHCRLLRAHRSAQPLHQRIADDGAKRTSSTHIETDVETVMGGSGNDLIIGLQSATTF